MTKVVPMSSSNKKKSSINDKFSDVDVGVSSSIKNDGTGTDNKLSNSNSVASDDTETQFSRYVANGYTSIDSSDKAVATSEKIDAVYEDCDCGNIDDNGSTVNGKFDGKDDECNSNKSMFDDDNRLKDVVIDAQDDIVVINTDGISDGCNIDNSVANNSNGIVAGNNNGVVGNDTQESRTIDGMNDTYVFDDTVNSNAASINQISKDNSKTKCNNANTTTTMCADSSNIRKPNDNHDVATAIHVTKDDTPKVFTLDDDISPFSTVCIVFPSFGTASWTRN